MLMKYRGKPKPNMPDAPDISPRMSVEEWPVASVFAAASAAAAAAASAAMVTFTAAFNSAFASAPDTSAQSASASAAAVSASAVFDTDVEFVALSPMERGRLPAEPCSMPHTDASSGEGTDASVEPARLPAEPCNTDPEVDADVDAD
jgi:hypothetical protein